MRPRARERDREEGSVCAPWAYGRTIEGDDAIHLFADKGEDGGGVGRCHIQERVGRGGIEGDAQRRQVGRGDLG
jgi:hypothetical protein